MYIILQLRLSCVEMAELSLRLKARENPRLQPAMWSGDTNFTTWLVCHKTKLLVSVL